MTKKPEIGDSVRIQIGDSDEYLVGFIYRVDGDLMAIECDDGTYAVTNVDEIEFRWPGEEALN
jgi:hypothetical protein